MEVCTYDYPNGHQHFNDDKDDKDDDDQGKYIIAAIARLVKFVLVSDQISLFEIFM